MRPSSRISLLICFVLCLALQAGCSLGYRNMHPYEDSAIYSPLFEDVITRFDAPEWLWTRGTISGDFDSSGEVEEEAVIATIQTGEHHNPNPIIAAYLVVCRVEANGSRTAIARTKLFDSDPFATATGIKNNVYSAQSAPIRFARAQAVPDKGKLGDFICVYFWSDGKPNNVWHAGYRLRDGMLEKVYDLAISQYSPSLTYANLDKRPKPVDGFQLVFPAAALPLEISSKLDSEVETPLWGHVFLQDEKGYYRQDDMIFGSNYSKVENSWNQAYLKALITDSITPSDLAWFEYHLGMMYIFIGKKEMAKGFIEKADKNSRDESLSKAIARAWDLLE